MHLIWSVVIGFVIGLVARALMPGRQAAGFIITALLGIVGALVASVLGQTLGLYAEGEPAGFPRLGARRDVVTLYLRPLSAHRLRRTLRALIYFCLAFAGAIGLAATLTHNDGPGVKSYEDDKQDLSRNVKTIPVGQTPHDHAIAERISGILKLTHWFTDLSVTSQDGLVRLKGTAQKQAQVEWAEALARDTDGVVAVLDELQVEQARWFDLTPARKETETLVHKTTAFLPYLITSLIVLFVFSVLSSFVAKFSRRAAERRMNNVLLIDLISRLAALPVFILGLYLVLQVCGLTGIAFTLIGGTGAFGLVAGLALKNILENYFSGIMLSLRNPYTVGDVVTLGNQTGVVQKLTTRGTVLVDFDGNHILIPNATIYANVITNRSVNPNTRVQFSIQISYIDSTDSARETILQIVTATKGVLANPEPMVLLSDFLPGAILISVYFWINSHDTSDMKLKSLLLEEIKEALQEKGFSLPGAVQQMAFPRGIPELQPPKALPPRDVASEAAIAKRTRSSEIGAQTKELLREANKGRIIDNGASCIFHRPRINEIRMSTNEIDLIIPAREVPLGGFTVKRILPYAKRRMVGPFIFLDHMGPHVFSKGYGMSVGPHPHIGLSTLTYLLEGQVLHRDSLGNEVCVRAGEVNWMTAGRGIAHAERSLESDLESEHALHGLQIWVALPATQEDREPSFVHIAQDQHPRLSLGTAEVRLLAGTACGKHSPVPVYSPLFLMDVSAEEGQDFVFDPDGQDLAVYVAVGALRLDGVEFKAGQMVVLTRGSALRLVGSPAARAFVLGGAPLAEDKHIWWNFVSSDREKIEVAKGRWEREEFPPVIHESNFSRVPLPKA